MQRPTPLRKISLSSSPLECPCMRTSCVPCWNRVCRPRSTDPIFYNPGGSHVYNSRSYLHPRALPPAGAGATLPECLPVGCTHRDTSRHAYSVPYRPPARILSCTLQRLVHGFLRRVAGWDVKKLELLERRQRTAVERGGEAGTPGVSDPGVGEVERLELLQLSSRRRRRACRRRRRR